MSTKGQSSLYQQMLHHVQSWKQQNVSRQLYCQQNGLSIGKFNYWILKLRKEQRDSAVPRTKGFTKIPDPAAVSFVGPSFQVELPNGNRINFFQSLTTELYKIFL